jgi:biotin carboxylase
MSRLLVIGASVLQLPAIIKAREMGHSVIVADFNSKAIGIPYADEFYNVSTIDIEAISRLAKNIQPDAIMTLATDLPMRSVAAATTLLNLPGISFEAAVKATDKAEMIRAFKEHHVESPWFHIIENEKEVLEIARAIQFPCIVKPTDNSGSRGVILVNQAADFVNACNYSRNHSRGGKIIVEEFMTGSEVSVEIIACEGNVHVIAVTDKITTGKPYFVELGHSQPSMIPPDMLNQIQDLAIRAVKAVGINQGAAHVEIMLTDKGPKMVELGARLGGDCISTHLVPLSTGVDIVKAAIELSLGKVPDLSPRFTKGSAIRYFTSKAGIIKAFSGIQQALKMDGIQEITFTKATGEDAPSIKSSTDRIGYVISQGKDAVQAVQYCEEAMKKVIIQIKEAL